MSKKKSSSVDNRAPLQPLDTIGSPQRTDYSYQSFLFDQEDENEFELMHIRITLLELTGVLCQKKKRMFSSGGSAGNSVLSVKRLHQHQNHQRYHPHYQPSHHYHSGNESMAPSLNSSITSLSANSADSTDAIPTTAVVTFRRNVSNSATSISSHLPSAPLGLPTSSFGKVSRYLAQWPANGVTPLLPELRKNLMHQSTFELQRVMMKEPFDRTRHHSTVSHFVQESIELQINLSKGTEMIPLGVATLIVAGDEEGPITMNLPAKAIRFKGKKMLIVDNSPRRRPTTPNSNNNHHKMKKRDMAASDSQNNGPARLFAKSSKRMAFSSDPARRYTLDENASLKIVVQVIPHGALKETEAAKARRSIKKRRRRRGRKRSTRSVVSSEGTEEDEEEDDDDDEEEEEDEDDGVDGDEENSILLSDTHLQSPRGGCCTTMQPAGASSQERPGTPKLSSNIFCANLCVDDLKKSKLSSSRRDYKVSSKAFQQRNSSYLRRGGSYDSFVLSSVSESGSDGDGSDSDDDDDDDDDDLEEDDRPRDSIINKRIVVRKK